LTLTLPESDRYFDDKLDILERNGLGVSATFNCVRGEDPPEEMMGFLRLMQLQGERRGFESWAYGSAFRA
jgi:[ribulose-bisphosphate carboxylase]-lysine N-methyltransferase